MKPHSNCYSTIEMYSPRMKALVVAISLTLINSVYSQDAKKDLFVRVEINQSDLTPKQQSILDRLQTQKSAAKVEIIRVNESALTSSQAAIVLNPTKELRFQTTMSEKITGDGKTYVGKTTEPRDHVQFVNRQGNVTGTIRADGKLFSLRPIGAGLHALIQQDEAKFPPEHPPGFEKREKSGTDNRRDAKPNLLNDATPTSAPLRILVAYTPEAASTTADIKGLVQLAVDETNTGYQNSKINLVAELADSFEVSYEESGSFDTDLDKFRGRNDGKMDEVHARRDQSKADVCVLLLKNSSSCGLADAIKATESTAFAVVSTECATGYYSFGHEIGHLQGARHNPETDATNSPFAHGHGYRYEPGSWRCIMSYNCSGGCTRIPYWSNPAVMKDGVPMGTTGTHNNAKVLNDTAATITNFRN